MNGLLSTSCASSLPLRRTRPPFLSYLSPHARCLSKSLLSAFNLTSILSLALFLLHSHIELESTGIALCECSTMQSSWQEKSAHPQLVLKLLLMSSRHIYLQRQERLGYCVLATLSQCSFLCANCAIAVQHTAQSYLCARLCTNSKHRGSQRRSRTTPVHGCRKRAL
jgi:hypothetical protein